MSAFLHQYIYGAGGKGRGGDNLGLTNKQIITCPFFGTQLNSQSLRQEN